MHESAGGNSTSSYCSNGFPERDRLVSAVGLRRGPAIQFIPEMNFTCNGIIAGFTFGAPLEVAKLSTLNYNDFIKQLNNNNRQISCSKNHNKCAYKYGMEKIVKCVRKDSMVAIRLYNIMHYTGVFPGNLVDN